MLDSYFANVNILSWSQLSITLTRSNNMDANTYFLNQHLSHLESQDPTNPKSEFYAYDPENFAEALANSDCSQILANINNPIALQKAIKATVEAYWA
jgi:hypothetical protein